MSTTQPKEPSPNPNKDPTILEYYAARKPYENLLHASHAQLPQWRDPEAKLNRKPANEPSPFLDEGKRGWSSFFGEQEGKIREEMRALVEKFEAAELKEREREMEGAKEKKAIR